MNTIKNTSKVLTLMTIFATTLLVVGSLTAAIGDQNTFAKKSEKSNNSTQGIGQETLTGQDALCDTGNNTLASCNNVALSFNLNDGNNAAGQQ